MSGVSHGGLRWMGGARRRGSESVAPRVQPPWRSVGQMWQSTTTTQASSGSSSRQAFARALYVGDPAPPRCRCSCRTSHPAWLQPAAFQVEQCGAADGGLQSVAHVCLAVDGELADHVVLPAELLGLAGLEHAALRPVVLTGPVDGVAVRVAERWRSRKWDQGWASGRPSTSAVQASYCSPLRPASERGRRRRTPCARPRHRRTPRG